MHLREKVAKGVDRVVRVLAPCRFLLDARVSLPLFPSRFSSSLLMLVSFTTPSITISPSHSYLMSLACAESPTRITRPSPCSFSLMSA